MILATPEYPREESFAIDCLADTQDDLSCIETEGSNEDILCSASSMKLSTPVTDSDVNNSAQKRRYERLDEKRIALAEGNIFLVGSSNSGVNDTSGQKKDESLFVPVLSNGGHFIGRNNRNRQDANSPTKRHRA